MSAQAPPWLETLQARVNQQLLTLTNPTVSANPNRETQSQLSEATTYVVRNGGKRVRPALVYLAAQAVEATQLSASHGQALDYAACAVELLHTYSLVHDDLPAMDDDALRRGQPSCHVAFDEATAILVGDTLQARAFELLALAPGASAEQRIQMMSALASAAGSNGMVGGQYVDIQATDSILDIDQLQAMHEAKTGAIITAALLLGAACANATTTEIAALRSFGEHIGLAFQVVDDVLDVSADSAALGKTTGKDSASNKPTYVSLLGLQGAREKSQDLLAAALAALSCFGESAEPLRELGRFIVGRDR